MLCIYDNKNHLFFKNVISVRKYLHINADAQSATQEHSIFFDMKFWSFTEKLI